MDDVVLIAVIVTLVATMIGVPLIQSILPFTTTPPADVVRIKANLGGIAGLAGIYRNVVDVRRIGGSFAGRSTPAKRKYLVTLERPDGQTEQRVVWIAVTLFGYGALDIEGRSRR